MPATPKEAAALAELKAALAALPSPHTIRRKLSKCRTRLAALDEEISRLAPGDQPPSAELDAQLRELLRQKDEVCAQEEELMEQRKQLEALHFALDELVLKVVDRERGRVIIFFDLAAVLREG